MTSATSKIATGVVDAIEDHEELEWKMLMKRMTDTEWM